MPRKTLRNPNKYGTIAFLGKNRRRPYIVKVNPKLNQKGHYQYDILGYYEERADALIALAEYNKKPFELSNREITFKELFYAYYNDKYFSTKKQYSFSSMNSTQAAFKNCSMLHDKKFLSLRHFDLQQAVDNCSLRHSSIELMTSLLHQMYAFSIREGILEKDESKYVQINVQDDDIHGIRFMEEDLQKLWACAEYDAAKMILIYIYSGWRATELLEIPKADFDFTDMTMKGGKKTSAGKNRIVPIHSKIKDFMLQFYDRYPNYLFTHKAFPLSYSCFISRFRAGLAQCGIKTKYTPHDCRHTFESKLDDAGVASVIRDRLMGHASKSIGERVYTHKTVEQLRQAVESIE